MLRLPRRRWRWLLAFVALSALAGACYLLSPSRPSLEQYHRIQLATSQSEVEAILGSPDAILTLDNTPMRIDHRSPNDLDPWDPPTRPYEVVWGYIGQPEKWNGPDRYYKITFGYDGNVYATGCGLSWQTTRRSRFALGLERLRTRIGLR
jgi:hypothetical protein